MTRRTRSANVLIIVCVLALVIFAALFSLSYLTRTDIVSSSNLLREITATALAESIAAQVEARVNSHPWVDRFWLDAAQAAGTATTGDQPPSMTLDRSCPFIDLSRDSTPEADYEFTGVVKDLSLELREYRLYLEVTVKGETYSFSWDKRWEMALLTALNRDMTQVGKSLDEVSSAPQTATDTLLDGIKDAANTAPPPDQPAPTVAAKIKRLRHDEKGFKATAVPGDPAAEPVVPQPPKGGGGGGKGAKP